MKCSFKNIRINILLVAVIMTLLGRGNPEKLRNVRGGRISNGALEFKESPEYVEEGNGRSGGYGIGDAKLKRPIEGGVRYSRNENQAIPDRKIVKKTRRVSLTHFPEEISKRKTEGSFIRQANVREANYGNTRHRVPTRRLVRARHTKRRNAPYRSYEYYPIDSPAVFRNRRKWLLPNGRLALPGGAQNQVVDDIEGDVPMLEQFEPCCKTGQPVTAVPQTYMVEVEPLDDGDDGCPPSALQPQLPLCNKYYYVFEKKPFKVKFLNFVSSPGKDCIPSEMRSPCSMNTPMKISMPAFLCKPPECREVLYCKYFQCTSLGFFPDSRNCRKYFFCDLNSNGFVLYHMLCPKGRIFDPCIRECRLKETMDKRDVERCRMQAERLKRGGRARIKKNESLSRDLIKYKERGDGEKYEQSSKVRRNSTEDDFENINSRHNPKHASNKKPNPTTPPGFTLTPLSFQTQLIPIPILATLPKYCETASMPISTTAFPPTAPTRPLTQHPQPPSPPQQQQPPSTPPPPPTTVSVTTPPPPPPPTIPTTTLVFTPASIPTTSPPTTTTTTTQVPAVPVLVQKSTLPICPPPPKRKKVTCPSPKSLDEYYMGDLDSDAYQDDMVEDEYSDDYYDVPDTEDGQEYDYDWLKKGLKEYLDMLKLTKDEKSEADTSKPEIYSQQSTPPPFNGYTYSTEGRDQDGGMFLQPDTDRGKRSEEKIANATVANRKENQVELPDFEKCYNDKKEMNLDGYPCKQYGRYPDKYDSTRYYECGAQPDGNMKIEHKRCPKGEEFSPEYLECVATEYLKVMHRRKRVAEARRPNKQRPTPEPEYNYEDDKEIPNEWLDASHGNKVPNEFKSKTKHTLRIFHLYCKRNSTELPQRQKRNRGGHKKQRHNARSFVVRHNKKEEQLDNDEDEEYEDDDEEYYDLAEEDGKSDRSTQGVPVSSSVAPLSSKVLLDADIRVDKQFENDLKSILGKRDEAEPKKDSILITLSGDKRSERSKRNFLKDLFSKKSTGDDPEKEGVVSMLTLINGLPSEYERDALLQKLERRKMMNSHIYRNRQRTLKKKADSELDLASNTVSVILNGWKSEKKSNHKG